ncbi:hypothetical protein [Ralstonia phage phiRSL1]|uniref:Uncharacterized protein n=1 Tax=Ralstonia phage phiRSL1 TaxID=1980924 RepID=C4T8X3_9CAUD|nr:hypothetical protein RSL1_ORF260 [Ralstonia phage phiRSL1]BAH72947.1 hypothetical protein [Ralstonia phage phiRSL1]
MVWLNSATSHPVRFGARLHNTEVSMTITVYDFIQDHGPLLDGPPTLTEHDLKCPECDKFHPVEDWRICEAACDSCGGHYSLRCPEYHYFDQFADDDTVLELQSRA